MSSPETGLYRGTLLQRAIAEIGTKGDFPAVAQVIQSLRTTVAREHCAALDVARIVLQDAGFASKLLRLVNSAYYRRQGEPVSTVTRAVMMVGFEAIRDQAAALLVLEELLRAGRANVYVRKGLCSALHRGLFAQRLSAQVGYPNPEEAYLLALFARWGTLWLATYYPADFERAHRLAAARDVPIEAAVREVFGGDPAELSAAIVDTWNFPETFAAHFRSQPPDDRAAPGTPAARLSAVVHFATDWTAALESGREIPRTLFDRAEAVFGTTPEKLLAMARETHEAMREQAAALGLGRIAEPVALVRAERNVRQGVALLTTPPLAATAGPNPPAAAPFPSAEQRRLEVVAEITRSIIEQRDINDILLMILESIVSVVEFDAALLALVNVQRDRIVGRMGCGAGVEELVGRLAVPLTRGTNVLADVVLERRSQLVSEGAAALLGTPPALPARSLVAAPLVVRDQCVGVVVAARGDTRAITAAERSLVELLSDQAAVAFHQAAR